MRLARPAVVGGALTAVAAASLVFAGSASAHVTVHSADAVQGGYSVLTFRVPTESDTASTTALAVLLPLEHPIASVSVQPHPGWSFTVKKTTLATPIKTEDGSLTQVVGEIDWKADSAATAIKPGEFDQFDISAGPLPDVSSLTFKALQTYSDGSVVKWIEQQAPGSTTEPDHPAPTIQLAAANSTASTAPAPASSGSSKPTVTAAAVEVSGKASTGAATTGIVLGAIGALLGAVALGVVLAGRRRSTT